MEKASKTSYYAIILGEDEIKEGYFSVKNLNTSTQERIDSFDEL